MNQLLQVAHRRTSAPEGKNWLAAVMVASAGGRLGAATMENDDEPMDVGGTLFSDNFILGFFRDAETDLLWKTSIKFV